MLAWNLIKLNSIFKTKIPVSSCRCHAIPEISNEQEKKECMPKWIHALILADVRRVHRSCYSARQHIFPKKMYLYIHAYI